MGKVIRKIRIYLMPNGKRKETDMTYWTVYFKSKETDYGGIVYEDENKKQWWLSAGRGIKPLLFSSRRLAVEKIKEIKTKDNNPFWETGYLSAEKAQITLV